MVLILPNSPLVKTVFEIRFALHLGVDAGKHSFSEEAKKNYPVVAIPDMTQNVNPILLPIRLISEDSKKTLTFSSQLFSFSSLHYEGFEKFKKEAIEITNHFIKKFNIKNAVRIGLLYVNNIPLEIDREGKVNIADYLQFGLKLPPNTFGDELTGFAVSFTHRYGNDTLRTDIQPRPKESDKTNTVILNFDYFIDRETFVGDLENFIVRGHDKIEKAFLNITTHKYQEYMKGVV